MITVTTEVVVVVAEIVVAVVAGLEVEAGTVDDNQVVVAGREVEDDIGLVVAAEGQDHEVDLEVVAGTNRTAEADHGDHAAGAGIDLAAVVGTVDLVAGKKQAIIVEEERGLGVGRKIRVVVGQEANRGQSHVQGQGTEVKASKSNIDCFHHVSFY